MADRQHNLFDTEVPQWELDSQAELVVATVVFPSGLAKPLDYTVPDSLRDSIEPGRRVRVPLGRSNRSVIGYCVAVENQQQSDRRLKCIDEVIDPQTLLSLSLLRLTEWMAGYYLCPWGQVLETVIPAGVRVGAGTRLTTLLTIAPDAKQKLSSLKLPKKQSAVIDCLIAEQTPLTPAGLASAVGCTQAPITALRRKGLIHSEVQRIGVAISTDEVLAEEPQLKLNADQSVALKGIMSSLRRQQHDTILIHGVTGSGKTEVYMHAIQEVVGYGRQAIVLVPEISLTPQTVSRFRARFGQVAVLHSHLTNVQRHQEWARISSGSVQVIVGARSAIFAPTPHLGLIVIDEEHESSFKQDTAPRYHAREVAQRRAETEGVPLVLGSATPSLESFQRSQEGQYKLVTMESRVFERPLP
ncbi:MAG: primosomal protein N', partial [Planctomycetales bacterium]